MLWAAHKPSSKIPASPAKTRVRLAIGGTANRITPRRFRSESSRIYGIGANQNSVVYGTLAVSLPRTRLVQCGRQWAAVRPNHLATASRRFASRCQRSAAWQACGAPSPNTSPQGKLLSTSSLRSQVAAQYATCSNRNNSNSQTRWLGNRI